MSSQLLEINHLSYETPEVPCASKKTQRQQFFANPNNYDSLIGGEVIPILFNTGKGFVDGSKSSLSFQMLVNVVSNGQPATYYKFDTDVSKSNTGSSAVNILEQILLESRSGEILDRQLYKNQLQTVREYRINYEKKESLSIMGGYSNTFGAYPLYVSANSTSFNIPLSEISSIFNTSQLLPEELLSGSKLTLVISQPINNLVFYQSDGVTSVPRSDIASVSITLSNISVLLQQSDLYDGIYSVLRSSILDGSKGLQFPYYSFHNSKYVPTSTSFTYDIQLAASKVSYVVVKFVLKNKPQTANAFSPTAAASIYELNNNQSLNDDNGLGFSIQFRLGNMIFPTYPLTNAPDAFVNTVQALNPISYSNTEDPDPLKITNKLQSGCVGYNNYSRISTTANGLSNGGVLFGMSLEKCSNIGLSGLTTSAGRVISVEVQGMNGYDLVDMFTQVKYLQVASIYENNVIVSK